MAVSKGEIFGQGDVYVDYEFERVMFRWDFREKKIYRKFYGEEEGKQPVPDDNRLYNDALLYGNEITRDGYYKGKKEMHA